MQDLRGWLAVDEGSDEGGPVGDEEVAGDRAEVLEEALAGADALAGFLPGPCDEIAERMEGEGEQVHGGQEGGEVLVAVTEVVFEIITLGLEDVETLVLVLSD